MAQPVEPMDVDGDFDDKENSYHHSNVLPCTEKGYEELDVSELNMKLRYSITPASSPMSKSYTAHCHDHRSFESGDDNQNITINENAHLTRSLNSSLKTDNIIKSLKTLPLQSISTEQFNDNNRSMAVLRPLDTTITPDEANVTVTVSGPNDIDENLSLPSSSSSAIHTPEATTPTKDISKTDGGSPIMRGLKSVLNMFRASQSPIPPESECNKQEGFSSDGASNLDNSKMVMASTPISAHRKKETSPSKRNSPYKESIVFNDDLEKELQWKDETTILFSQERIPIHKLFLQQTQPHDSRNTETITNKVQATELDSTVEYMDISFNDSILKDKVTINIQADVNRTETTIAGESDSEFVDCETTFTKNESQFVDDITSVDKTQDLTKDMTKNESNSKLKPIILNTTQDILDATLSITPEDIYSVVLGSTKEETHTSVTEMKNIIISDKLNEIKDIEQDSVKHQVITGHDRDEKIDQTFEITSQIINTGSDNLNDTNTIGNITTGIEMLRTPNTVKLTDNLDGTRTIDTDSTVKNFDTTHTIETDAHTDRNSEEQAAAQNLDVTHNIEKSVNTLNVTNTIEINALIGGKSQEQVATKNLDATHTFENQPKVIDNLVTKEFEACIDKNTEELATVQDLDATHNIENTGDITFDMTKMIETDAHNGRKSEAQAAAQNLDVTHNIENAVGNFDVTKTIENDALIGKTSDKQAIAQNLDATHIIENQPKIDDNLNIAPPVEMDANIQSLDVTHTLKNDYVESQILVQQASHLDTTEDIDNKGAEDSVSTAYTTVQDIEPTIIYNNVTSGKLVETLIVDTASNFNITNENISNGNKTEDNSNIPILENNNLVTEHEFAIEQVDYKEDITNTVTVEETSKPIEGHFNEILPKQDVPISVGVTPLELLADIPLPDEDDIDKELNVENTADNIIEVPCNLALDLVDDRKTKTTEATAEKEITVVQPKVLLTNAINDEENTKRYPIIEASDYKVVRNKEEINIIERGIIPDTSENVPKEMLLKVIPLPDNLIIHDEVIATAELNSSKILNNTQVIMEPTNNSTLQNVILGRKPELDTTLPMDINESICEYKPLPDIINQITATCQDDIGQAVENIELVKQQASVELATIGDNIEPTTIKTPSGTETLTVSQNKPQESGDLNVCTKTKNSVIPIADDVPVISESEKVKVIHDNIANNMSVDEICENSENMKKGDIKDITTPDSVLSPAQINNMSPKTETSDVIVGDVIIDEEVVASENNSPFVCVTAAPDSNTDTVDVEKPVATKIRIVFTPPASPPIASKGYNFNFDEYDDPFDTKTTIRISPPLDTPSKSIKPEENERNEKRSTMGRQEVNNRRKAQTERKRPPANKNKLNSTYNSSLLTNQVNKPVEEIEVPSKIVNESKSYDTEDKEVQDIIKTANKNIEQKLREALKVHEEIEGIDMKIVDTIPPVERSTVDSLIEAKTTSFSEKSTYFSAGTSSSDSIKSKNVFNLPEIDDMDFNPFATKSKMRQSPPLAQDEDNPFATRSKIMSSLDISLNDANVDEVRPITDDKMETELMEKDSSTNINISNVTTSSKATDERDTTVREVNTEDEDTAEGPFLEVEDLHSDVKTPELDTENDMMQFHVLPPQVKVENQDDELFIDAEAFEYLLNQNKSATIVDSGKESLFLKFDPLFAKRMSSDGVLAALTQLQKRQSTPTKLTRLPQKDPISPIAGPSNANITHNIDVNTSEELNDDLNVTVSKPMMVVPPAVNPITPRNKSVTPTRPNRRSVTFTSPAMAVIDRLLSLSANNSPIYDNTYTHVSREQTEADLALVQLRELLAEKEVHVYNLRTESKELKDRLSTMESQVRILETESQTRLKKINELNETLVEKSKMNKSMAAVVEEYERTIASLIAEIEQDKKRHAEERMQLINERDEQTAHLASMEVSFSDLHSKYEKSKQVIFSCKANEDVYKKSIKQFEENVAKMQKNFDLLKQHATSKLNHANQELEKMNKAHEAEVVKLSAMIKRKELHITSLEETLTQKTKANEELTAICDELINKVG